MNKDIHKAAASPDHARYLEHCCDNVVKSNSPALLHRHWVDDGSVTRRHLIEKLAYEFAAARGFAPGGELQDWLCAEAEVDRWMEGRHYSGD